MPRPQAPAQQRRGTQHRRHGGLLPRGHHLRTDHASDRVRGLGSHRRRPASRRDRFPRRPLRGHHLTPGGPKVLEFNVRFGDPECQPLMTRLQSDALELLWATAAGKLDQIDVQYTPQSCVTVVLASKGYPESPKTGFPINGIEDAEAIEGVSVYHAGTKLNDAGTLVTSGGRVLSVTALGDSMEQARQRAYEAADKIHFEGMQLRTDIAKDAPVATA
ncbi:MAG TPA: hypothetical protein DF699_07835 [Phycisphaerales bacterium]|nr:hypothetical protein [Phycisphaerales bacterium]